IPLIEKLIEQIGRQDASRLAVVTGRRMRLARNQHLLPESRRMDLGKGDGGGLAVSALRCADPAARLAWYERDDEEVGLLLEELREPARDRKLLKQMRRQKTDRQKLAWIRSRPGGSS